MIRRDVVLMALLAALPVLALAPAWREGRLLGPGDGAALHLPLRTEVWRAYVRGDRPTWNPSAFSGTPLLAAYRPGAFYPPMAALALLPPFLAFQTLVLASLSAAAVLTYLYLRRLGANRPGAYLAGLAFPLGPYLVAHLGDTATVVASPLLPLVLLAVEVHLARGGTRAAAGLAVATALLLVAGSPTAVGACALLALGRLALAHSTGRANPTLGASALAVAAGLLLAAPQLLPTAFALANAGPGVDGLADTGTRLPGVTGLVLRYVSHTPAALALAALPSLLTHPAVRRAAGALALGLALLAASGRPGEPGVGALLADFAFAVLLGLSLSVQWAARKEAFGRRLRVWSLLGALASAAALSVAAAVTGPLPQLLAGAVGLLAVSLILYFSLADARAPAAAHAFLLPLTVAFVMQPQGREAWAGAPTEAELSRGTPTREAIDRAMGPRREERALSLVTAWPRAEARDLAYGNLGGLSGRRNAEGYDPMVPRSRLAVYEGMSAGGMVPRALLGSDPGRLELLGIRFVQVPSGGLTVPGDDAGLGEELDLGLEAVRARFFALPITRATEVRFSSSLAGSVEVPQGTEVARVFARLVTGREIELPVRAGIDTAEWAYERSDVLERVRHARARVVESFPAPGGFLGHHYLGVLRLPGRYAVDGVRFQALPGAPPLTVRRVGVRDGATGRALGVSQTAAYVSDTLRLQETAATPNVHLFEVLRGLGRAWVVESLLRVKDEDALGGVLRGPTRAGIDARRQAVVVAGDAVGLSLPAGSRSSRAELARETGGRLELRAEGPGLLVVTESFDRGWSGEVDDSPTRVIRVNGASMGLVIPGGTHRVVLRHEARGLAMGVALAALAALGTAAAVVRPGARS